MKVIKGTQDAKRMKGIVQSQSRTIRCPCGAQAQPVAGSNKNYHCGKCGRGFTATSM